MKKKNVLFNLNIRGNLMIHGTCQNRRCNKFCEHKQSYWKCCAWYSARGWLNAFKFWNIFKWKFERLIKIKALKKYFWALKIFVMFFNFNISWFSIKIKFLIPKKSMNLQKNIKVVWDSFLIYVFISARGRDSLFKFIQTLNRFLSIFCGTSLFVLPHPFSCGFCGTHPYENWEIYNLTRNLF